MKNFISLSVAAFFVLSACAAPVVKTTALVPAKFHEATKLKEIAVLPFDGPGGKEFAAEIEGTLASINIDDQQYFTLIERTRIEKILSEQALSQTGVIDETTAGKVGKLIGAKGIYTGVVNTRNIQNNHYRENREECVYREIKYDKKGKAYEGNCVRWRKYAVSCAKKQATFAFTPKLIEVQTGRIVYSNNKVWMESSSACQDSRTPLASDSELIAKAKEKAKMSFKKDIAPNYVTFTVTLMDSKEGITSNEAEQKMDQGSDFAGHNRLDRACELWGEARILSPNAPSLIYNLGVCAEVRGDLENALELYKKAERAFTKPDHRITSAIARCSEAIKRQKVLKEELARTSPSP